MGVLDEELDLVDVDLDLGEVDGGLVDNEGPFLAEELRPLLVVLVPQELDRFEDGQPRLQLLRIQLILVLEHHLLEGLNLDIPDNIHLVAQSTYSLTYIFLSLLLSLMRSSMWFLTLSKEKR